MKLALSFRLILLATTLLCHFVYVCPINCPQTVYVALGRDGIINCRIKNNGDVYWYEGNSTKTSPIVRRENGQKKISQEGSPYDMDGEGSLIIRSLEEQYYGIYSVLNFYANDQLDTAQIKVEMAVKPLTMCPAITGCNDCDQCELTESETSNISCSISGTRPQVDLIIVTDSGNWINVNQNVSESTYDAVTGTWSTTTTVKYSQPNECGPPLQFRCVTESGNPFELSDSVAQVKPGSCKTTTQSSSYDTPLVEDKTMMYVLIAILIAVVVMVIAIVLVLCLVKSQKLGTSKTEGRHERNMEMPEEMTPLQMAETISDTDHKSLMNTLEEAYEKFRDFTCNPNGKIIPAKDVFQGVNFTLMKTGKDADIIPSSKLIETLFEKERNFVFLDDSEYGRNAFTKYVCSSLCGLSLDQDIILYVNLKELDKNVTIANAVNEHMSLGETCPCGFIGYILKNKRCLFVFDEINEIYQPIESANTSTTENQQPDEETINGVLNGSTFFQRYPNARILCIPKNGINITSCLKRKQVFFKIAPLSLENLKVHLTNIFSRYESEPHKSNEKNETDDKTIDKLSDVGRTIDDERVECVANLILEEDNILQQIDMCPSLLILLTHSLVFDIINKTIRDLRFYIHRRSYLTRLIVDCLRFQHFPCEPVGDDSERIMISLGQASFEANSLEDIQFTEPCDLVYEYTRAQLEAKTNKEDFEMAFAMGFLKLKAKRYCGEDVTNIDYQPSPDSLINFRHNNIQEYLAAKAIASNKTVEKRFLKSPALKENDRIKRVLQFMHVTDAKKRQELLKILVKEMRWNNLIDCLFESENDDDDFMKIKSALPLLERNRVVNIIDMDLHYHGMAVTRFCKLLANNRVSLNALSFQKSCKFEYFSNLEIPEVNYLVFLEIDFQQENNFIDFVKKACQLNVKANIEFVRCKCPDTISEEDMEDIGEVKKLLSKSPKIRRTNQFVAVSHDMLDIFQNVKWYELDLERGLWK